jgi:hypothetical protein
LHKITALLYICGTKTCNLHLSNEHGSSEKPTLIWTASVGVVDSVFASSVSAHGFEPRLG